MSFNLITILGPTATGKTKLASRLAAEFDGEIISADSRQVYKGMDIGTGKDLDDYLVENQIIPCHLIDIIEPHKEFNLFLFKEYFSKIFININNRKKLPFLVGGSGLYLSSVLQCYDLQKADFNKNEYNKLNMLSLKQLQDILLGLNLKLHNTTDLIKRERIVKAIIIQKSEEKQIKKFKRVNSLVIGIKFSRNEIKERITDRLKTRLDSGMIEEVQKLIENGISFDKLNFFGLEYRYIGMYLKGELNYNDMFQKLNSAIHNFAKRQMTWFRKMEREGIKINWIEGPAFDTARDIISKNMFNTKLTSV